MAALAAVFASLGGWGCGPGANPPPAGPTFLDDGLAADPAFPFAAPDPARVDVTRLQALMTAAGDNQSASLVVIQDGKIIVERYFGAPAAALSIQSVTKSISSLAVGFLLQQGALASLDTPLSTYYPEWGQGQKAQATVRDVLTMSTGVVDDPTGAFWNQPNLLSYARAQPLATPPGQQFAYSDLAVELLSGVVTGASSQAIDAYLKAKLFEPLGMQGWRWFPDQAGNMQISGGLYVRPRDLARVGWFAFNQGSWNGSALLPASWFAASDSPSAPNPCYGLLWWLVRDGCPAGSLVAPSASTVGTLQGVNALGYGGQYIVLNA
ncbi:MAG TPA: serine hydrolase domain-containing protein, partial [Myxococcaceae bacterium]|nr:serine hydrolase domain-containing protein [Myxococcaceae bacterium]